MIASLPVDNVPTEQWVQDHVEWLWGFRLERFQLDIVMLLLGGGVMSILMPTDHGKSTCLKISVVLSLILNPQQPNIIVKISKTAAIGALQSIVFTLIKASEEYEYVKPMVRMNRSTGLPLVGHSFMIKGGDWSNVDNPSVYAASIWEADLQGRRGRAHVDDIETEREGRYLAYRERLEARVDSVLRTIEDKALSLFAFFGTPQHGESIYFKIVDKLRLLGQRFKVIKLPWKDPVTGKLLWPLRANKIEIHRRAMTPWAFAVAYELEPAKVGRLSFEEIERVKDTGFPYCKSRKKFESWLRATYDNADTMLAMAHYYIGYDPSAEYDFAVGAMCYIGPEKFMLDAYMEPGDITDQMRVIEEMYQRIPDAIIVIERNGQQKAYRDLLAKKLPHADVQMHQTTDMKDDEKIGIPSMLMEMKQGRYHLPYGDDTGANISEYAIEELRNYSPLSHPHLLPALWFPHYWHEKYIVGPMQEAADKAEDDGYKIIPTQLDRARKSWGRASMMQGRK